VTSVHECSICGYQYDPAIGDPENGVAAGTPFADLPPEWVCPLCGASQDLFNEVERQAKQPEKPAAEETVKEYRNKDIVVHWYPKQCSHAGKCWKEMPWVFNPAKQPWINIETCSTEDLIRTIDLCPSHAIRYSLPEGSTVDPALAKGPGSVDYQVDTGAAVKIRMVNKGPLLVQGPVQVFDHSGELIRQADSLVLCRCGKTKNQPFCDGSHLQENEQS